MKHKCQECNREISPQGMGLHVKGAHDMTYDEYLEKYVDYVDSHARCEVCGNITRIQGDKFVTCSRKCNAKLKSERYKGHDWVNITDKMRETISKKAKKRLSDPTNHPMYGKKHSEETKKKISESHKKLYKDGYVNPMEGKKHTLDSVKKIFSSWNDSSREKEMMSILDEIGVDYTHQFFLSRENTIRSYDFHLKDTDILIEVDGDYWHGGPGSSVYFDRVNEIKENDRFKDTFAKEHGYKVIRFWGSRIKDDPESVLEEIIDKINIG